MVVALRGIAKQFLGLGGVCSGNRMGIGMYA